MSLIRILRRTYGDDFLSCHPSYSPCVPNGRDYNCGELHNGPYVVKGPDD